jgi:two-component system cell cycle sensor histidine kinase/response regulator CckA
MDRVATARPEEISDTDRQQERRPQDDGRLRLHKKRAIIVEDELFVAWHIESLLQDAEVEVCAIAADGEEAIEKVSDLMPDLVIMDINLGDGMDGIEAAERIRELTDAKIVFVTANGDRKTVARVAATVPGAPVVAKPTSAAILRAAIGAPQ